MRKPVSVIFLTAVPLVLAAQIQRAPRPPQDAAVAPVAEARIALVIGNAAYKDAPLKNPVNDARAIEEALKKSGFAVTELENATRNQMREAIRAFGSRIAEGGVGLFYFAGHGMQVKGRNYLIPVGADIATEDEVASEALEVDAILAKMETARNRLNVLILDACRNNPFGRSFRSSQQGLAQMDAPTGTFVAFATAPGRTAADGSGANGLYTEALLHQFQTPGLKLEDVFKRTRAEVLKASSQQQTPWENSSIVGDFYFVPGTAPSAALPPAAPIATLPQVANARQAPAPAPEEIKLLEAMREKGAGEKVLRLAKPLAAKGSLYGKFALGSWSEDGPTRNRAIAQAAKEGIPLAMAYQAEFILGSPLSQNDVKTARELLEQAAALGEPYGKFALGIQLLNGKHFTRDPARAERLFAEAAEGSVGYYYGVGCVYWDDEDCRAAYTPGEADAKGLAFMRRGAELGEIGAISMMANAYQFGAHAPKDPGQSLQWWMEAANQDPDPYWSTAVAKFYRNVDDPHYRNGEEAIRWFTKAAAKGDAQALGEMAEMYLKGDLVPKDLPKAVSLYRQAAERGQGESQRDLGELYEKGEGIPKDLAQAYFWYVVAGDIFGRDGRQRLDKQLPEAQRSRIETKAAEWFRARAEKGSHEDQFRFGEICENGWGVPANPTKAYFWYVLAGDKYPLWTGERERLGRRLNPAERSRIEAQAEQWKPLKDKK